MNNNSKPIASKKQCLSCGDIFGLRLVEGLYKFYYFCPKHDPAFQRLVTTENNVTITMRQISGFEEVA